MGKKLFSLAASVMLVSSTLLIGISIRFPNASAVDHDIGNLDVKMLTAWGRILEPIMWYNEPQTLKEITGLGFIGLVMDQDNYNHVPGSENIADSFLSYPYLSQDDLTLVTDTSYIINNVTMQKSQGQFQNTGAGTGDPNDVFINQTAWSVNGKDWVVIQWEVINVKGFDITGFCLGLELPLSQAGAGGGVGGDSGDDIDDYDAVNNIYWAQDDDDSAPGFQPGDCIGFGSAIASEPITHYYSEDYHPATYDNYKTFWENDTWLYQRIHAPNATVGAAPGNRTSTVGWNDITIPVGGSRTFTFVISAGGTNGDMVTAFQDAQNYYRHILTGLRITEFSDASSGTQQIELFNLGLPPVDLVTEGFYFTSNSGPLIGNWIINQTIPTYAHAVFEVTGGTVGNESDIISLYHPVDGLIDRVSFGQEGLVPDPLNGESVARRFDAASAVYTNEWLRNASTGPTWGAGNDVGFIISSPWVVLNRVMFNPKYPDEGYIELMYPGFAGIAISNYRIVCDYEFIMPIGTVLNTTNRYYVLKFTDLPAFFTNMSATGDNVYLYDNNGNLVDMVGWSSSHNQGEFMSRIPDGTGTYQGYDDITSQAAGWSFNQAPSLLITEFYADSTSAQTEVYNQRGGDKVLDSRWGFTVDSGALTGTCTPNSILSGGYSTFTMAGGSPNDEGDTISLLFSGMLLDEVSFGIKGVPPDPVKGESASRYWDYSIPGYNNEWMRDPTSTFGTQNDVPPANISSELVLNEIMFNPNIPDEGFVELYLDWDRLNMSYLKWGKLNISGYKIVGDLVYVIPNGTELYPGNRFFYLLYYMDPSFFAALNSSGDNVYLYDNNNQLVDMTGWSSSHMQGTSMCRSPRGSGQRDGFNDPSSISAGWVFNCAPSIQLIEVRTEEVIKYGDFGGILYFNLTIINKQDVNDTVLIFNSTLNGYPVNILDGTGSFIITEIIVPAGSQVNITVKIILPATFPFIESDNLTITIQSKNITLFKDVIVLRAFITPFIWPEKYAVPQQIYLNGTGHDEITTIALNLTGMGAVLDLISPQDVIFCVDISGSIREEDLNLTREGAPGYIDEMSKPERGSLVVFDDEALLIDPLTDDYEQLKSDIANNITSGGGTSIALGLQTAINESLLNGKSSHIQVIILISDGVSNALDKSLTHDLADFAAANNITIFTVGAAMWPGHPGEVLLKEVANRTGGQFLLLDSTSQFPGIYKFIESISSYTSDIAGKDVDINDAVPMVRDVLPPWIELLQGSFSRNPDANYENETGYRILEWNISAIHIGEIWNVTFQVKSNKMGWVRANELNSSRVYYVEDYFENEIFRLFPECLLNVLPSRPLPPKLYIDILPKKNDILLFWDEPISPGTDHYLIYKAMEPNGFNFSSPWINTSSYVDPLGPGVPMGNRLSWNHTGSAEPGHLNYSDQWYYCIRSVNTQGEISHTSRTVGKWTKEFSSDVSTFSIPLEPLATMWTNDYLTEMNARYVKWMDTGLHIWMKHGDGGDNNTQMEVGKGYEIAFDTPSKYTFLGMPGAMIKYGTFGSFGFDYDNDAKSLFAAINPGNGDVTLTWDEASGIGVNDRYDVYYSISRDGFNERTAVLFDTIPAGLPRITVHSGITVSPGQYYYMVIPVNETNIQGSSTYSIGIWTEEYLAEYDTFGIPLKMSIDKPADWYCDNIPDTVGINYYIDSGQRWNWHSTRMPEGAYDPMLVMTEGYQISTSNTTKFTFIGV